ncbi:uncharacterized protein LOC111038160 [Myzus persicae]|uniref:uncharacterized protein LOC111038160 n=1 Tax=Myzus persicae TaxID=13164 RepID=UPI000B936481|nr:uncharacterized protein LOC111038160 [Myzus persicae]
MPSDFMTIIKYNRVVQSSVRGHAVVIDDPHDSSRTNKLIVIQFRQTCPLGSRDQVVENIIHPININYFNLRSRFHCSCRIEVCCRVVAVLVVCAVRQLKYECSVFKNFLSLPFHLLLVHNTCFNTYTDDPLPFDFLQKTLVLSFISSDTINKSQKIRHLVKSRYMQTRPTETDENCSSNITTKTRFWLFYSINGLFFLFIVIISHIIVDYLMIILYLYYFLSFPVT